jgi:hypothetical protein
MKYTRHKLGKKSGFGGYTLVMHNANRPQPTQIIITT